MTTCAPPRIHLSPIARKSRADDVLEMAELVGFELDPWQKMVIEGSCGVRHDGKWAAKRVGINVPRQNGKGGILELIELTALFTWGADLVIHSAHEFITSQKHSARMWSLVERTPSLLNQVYKKRLVGTHGQEAVKLNDGRMIEFRSRTKAGGRGFSCDYLFLDEAMILPEDTLAALLPTLASSARIRRSGTRAPPSTRSATSTGWSLLGCASTRSSASRTWPTSSGAWTTTTRTRCRKRTTPPRTRCGNPTLRSGSGSSASTSTWRTTRWTGVLRPWSCTAWVTTPIPTIPRSG